MMQAPAPQQGQGRSELEDSIISGVGGLMKQSRDEEREEAKKLKRQGILAQLTALERDAVPSSLRPPADEGGAQAVAFRTSMAPRRWRMDHTRAATPQVRRAAADENARTTRAAVPPRLFY